MRRWRAQRGQSMAEFAIVAQVFLLLCFLIYQGGVAWFDKLSLEQGTRDAARKAAVNRALGQSGMNSVAVAALRDTAGALNPSQLRIDPLVSLDNPDGPDGTLWGQGDLLKVHAEYPFSIGIFGFNLGGTLTSTTWVRIE